MFPVRTGTFRLSAHARRVSGAVRRGGQPTGTAGRTTARSSTLRNAHSRAVVQRGALLQTAQIIVDAGMRTRLGAELSVMEGEGDDDGT